MYGQEHPVVVTSPPVKFKYRTYSSPPLSTLNNRFDPPPIIFGKIPWASGIPVTFNLPVTTIWEYRGQSLVMVM
jgi:hypothetical protein